MKKIIKPTIFMLIFIVLFCLISRLLEPKYADDLVEGSMIRAYYQEEKNHEVIFVGDCEVYANFSPMAMYEEAGIKAYVRGSSQQLIWQSYHILKETLKYEKPKVVVFNVNALRYDKNSTQVKEEYNRLTIDGMKWSKEKIDIINESMTNDETFLSYLFPIIRYHSRYNQLTKEDIKYFFKNKVNTFNGFLINKDIKPVVTLPVPPKLPSYEFSEETMKYLNMMVELCQANGTKLVLVKAPSLYPHWYEEYDALIKNYANHKGIKYYNFTALAEEVGLDYNLDTYDSGLHLNLTGATKLSKYFANILKIEYNLTDTHGDLMYEEKLKAYQQATE